MEYLFLKKDELALQGKKEEIRKQMFDAAQDAALQSGQSAETWHDNFGHEEAVRQQRALSKRLAEIYEIENKIKIVEPVTKTEKVDIGLVITLKDVKTGEEKTVVVGSYMVLEKAFPNGISYHAPIIKPFMGLRNGQGRVINVRGEKKKYKVVNIQFPK